MDLFLSAASEVFAPANLLILLASTILGIVIGAIPGLTVTMAVALAVPLTIWMDTTPAMLMLLGLYGSGTRSFFRCVSPAVTRSASTSSTCS